MLGSGKPFSLSTDPSCFWLIFNSFFRMLNSVTNIITCRTDVIFDPIDHFTLEKINIQILGNIITWACVKVSIVVNRSVKSRIDFSNRLISLFRYSISLARFSFIWISFLISDRSLLEKESIVVLRGIWAILKVARATTLLASLLVESIETFKFLKRFSNDFFPAI